MDKFYNEMFNFLAGLLDNTPKKEDKVGNEQVGEYTIDTLYCWDVDKYETAVRKGNGNWVVVLRYETRELAEKGHALWAAVCAGNPVGAYSVQFNQYVRF